MWLPHHPTAKDLGTTALAAAQAILFVLGGSIAVFGVAVSLSRHRRDLGSAELARQQHAFEQGKEEARVSEAEQTRIADVERTLRARFSDAVGLLSDSSSAVKRNAGLYAIANLADDWAAFGSSDQRQVCIDVLCGYLRAPVPPRSSEDELEVRRTGYALIRSHLADTAGSPDWSECVFPLQGIRVDHEVDLHGLHLGDRAQLLLDGARVTAPGRLRLDHLTGSGQISLERVTVVFDLQSGEVVEPVVDLTFLKLDGALLRLDRLAVDGPVRIDFVRSELRHTTISMVDAWVRHGSVRFRPDLMDGGGMVVRGLHLFEGALFSCSATTFIGEAAVRFEEGRVEDNSFVELGEGTGLAAEPMRRRQVSLADTSKIRLHEVEFIDAAELRVDGIVLEDSAELDLATVVLRDEADVTIGSVAGPGFTRPQSSQ